MHDRLSQRSGKPGVFTVPRAGGGDKAIRRSPCRIGIAMTAFCVLASNLAWPSLPALAHQSSETSGRPRIGLVLAGGGAKGVAHVGVIKSPAGNELFVFSRL